MLSAIIVNVIGQMAKTILSILQVSAQALYLYDIKYMYILI